MSLECLNPAYNRIVNSSLLGKILDKREILYNVLLYDSIYVDGTEPIFKKAEKVYYDKCRKISERSEFSQDILLLEKDLEEICFRSDFEKYLIDHPSFLGQIILGDEIFDYHKFNFPSLKSLEKSLASFCVGEKHLLKISDNKDVWRNKEIKNEISLCMHGDLHVSQTNVFGSEFLDRTLFGNQKVFEIYNNFEFKGHGLYAYQDWSTFLVSTLEFARYLGKKEIPEIIEWRSYLESLGGGVGTATSEAMFGTNFSDFDVKFLFERNVLRDDLDKIEMFPIVISGRGDNYKLPYLNEGKLSYLIDEDTGNINFGKFFGGKNFSKTVEYDEDDLIPVLTAIYKYFARDKTKMYKIMDYFNLND
jgi:hypothetical protein